VTYSGANGGKIILGAVNTYTGPTVIGSSGDTAITVQLGVANALSSSTKVTLGGGTLNLGGFSHTMTGTTLAQTASSVIDFTSGGASSVSFANSSAQTWTGTLDLANWTAGVSTFQVGTDTTGLSSGQLGDIEFDNNPATLGSAYLLPDGVVVPEPSTLALGLLGGLGGLGMIWRSRSRKA
jgi:hypothetical protein